MFAAGSLLIWQQGCEDPCSGGLRSVLLCLNSASDVLWVEPLMTVESFNLSKLA